MQWSTMNSVRTHFAVLQELHCAVSWVIFVVIFKKRNHANGGACANEKVCRITWCSTGWCENRTSERTVSETVEICDTMAHGKYGKVFLLSWTYNVSRLNISTNVGPANQFLIGSKC